MMQNRLFSLLWVTSRNTDQAFARKEQIKATKMTSSTWITIKEKLALL